MASGKRVVIWGVGEMAELAHHYLQLKNVSVDAFVVDSEYASTKTLFGQPVVTPESLKDFSPETHDAFVAIGYSRNNRNRQEKVQTMLKMGYSLISIKANSAVCYLDPLPNNTFIGEGVIIEPFVKFGMANIFWSGSHICHHSTLADFNFFSPGSLVCGNSTVGSFNFFGAHSTLRDGLSVGNLCVLGASVFADQKILDRSVLTDRGPLPFSEKK